MIMTWGHDEDSGPCRRPALRDRGRDGAEADVRRVLECAVDALTDEPPEGADRDLYPYYRLGQLDSHIKQLARLLGHDDLADRLYRAQRDALDRLIRRK